MMTGGIYLWQHMLRRWRPRLAMRNFTGVTEVQNMRLIRPIYMEEVRSTIFDMHPEKPPGSDGMNPPFFRAFWDVVGFEVSRLCASIFDTGSLPPNLKITNIVLNLKKRNQSIWGIQNQ
ncbi:unnamed protein product [Cuscuta europaea]|uniref:Reverse transcriptase n=1 Tax=Cuscuta europaea TaxID=41803 RepID=A0A9P0ZIK9_CUSEU|nr:unnamed protein product [Cuscuta europaea]